MSSIELAKRIRQRFVAAVLAAKETGLEGQDLFRFLDREIAGILDEAAADGEKTRGDEQT